MLGEYKTDYYFSNRGNTSLLIIYLSIDLILGMATHTCSTSTREVESGAFVSLRSAWETHGDLDKQACK